MKNGQVYNNVDKKTCSYIMSKIRAKGQEGEVPWHHSVQVVLSLCMALLPWQSESFMDWGYSLTEHGR